jgi:hypothetical protein
MVCYRVLYFVFVTVVLALFSCGHKPDQVSIDAVKATAIMPADKDAVIYDFIKMVIADQELDKANWLNPLPAEISVTRLNEMLIDSGSRQSVKTSADPGNIQVQTHFGLPQCLRQDDIFFMQKQLPGHTGFQWDHVRLGFASHQTGHWYQLSVPVFSRDSVKAIITVLSLCKGLCGQGQTIAYQKTNNRWVPLGADRWFY